MEQIKKMYADGVGLRKIAGTLKMSRNTVRKYIYLHKPPEKKGHKTTTVAHYNEYLYGRIQENKGVETLQLFKEIKAMGHNGGRSLLYKYLKPYVKQRNTGNLLKLSSVSWVASKVRVMLCKKEALLFCQGERDVT